MPEKILFLELFQPFAQYRNPFTFYYAQTFPLPPKSTIIGMLQNAVGDWYGKNEEYEIENEKGEKEIRNRWWELKISVHGGFESVFWNYQQLIKGNISFSMNGILLNANEGNPGSTKNNYVWLPLYSKGITSQRSPVYQQELFNGHLYIFIRGDENLLEEIKKNLQDLKKILYLGRSEDVIFVKNLKFIEEREIEEREIKKSLWLIFPTYIKLENFPIANQRFPVYSIPVEVKFKNKRQKNEYDYIKHKSEITKQTERDVKFKSVIYSTPENPIYLDEEKGPIKVEKIKLSRNEVFKIPQEAGWL